MSGSVSPGDPTVNDGFAKSKRKVDNAFFWPRPSNGIKIVGARDSGDVGVKAVRVTSADHLLKDDRHFFVDEPSAFSDGHAEADSI